MDTPNKKWRKFRALFSRRSNDFVETTQKSTVNSHGAVALTSVTTQEARAPSNDENKTRHFPQTTSRDDEKGSKVELGNANTINGSFRRTDYLRFPRFWEQRDFNPPQDVPVSTCLSGDDRRFHEAAKSGDAEFITLFLEKGGDIAVKDNHRYQALHVAAKYGKDEIVQLLLKRGADVNARGFTGLTALHLAAGRGGIKVILTLLKAGACVDAKNSRGCTALHVAVEKGMTAVVELLLDFTALIPPDRGLSRLLGSPQLSLPRTSSLGASYYPFSRPYRDGDTFETVRVMRKPREVDQSLTYL